MFTRVFITSNYTKLNQNNKNIIKLHLSVPNTDVCGHLKHNILI